MTNFGTCYDSTGSRCSGKPQSGTIALRDGVFGLGAFDLIGSLGIYNCRPSSGGGSSLSTHAEGRGWDARCRVWLSEEKVQGDLLAKRLVANTSKLGIQRIIWNHREWNVRRGTWAAYGCDAPGSKKHHHTDHLHIELCWRAAAGTEALTATYVMEVLGEEDDMPSIEEIRQVVKEEVNRKVVDSEWLFHNPRYKDLLAAIKAVASGSADAEAIVNEIAERLARQEPPG